MMAATSPIVQPPSRRTPFVYPNGHLMETALQFLQQMWVAVTEKLVPIDSPTFRPGASVAPEDNGDLVVEATDNTTLTFKFKGSDGVVRSGAVTLT